MVTAHPVGRNAAVARFFAINLVKMLDGLASTPALLTQFIAKNRINIDVLPIQTTRPDLLLKLKLSLRRKYYQIFQRLTIFRFWNIFQRLSC